ncbi:PQQ-dependent sugar dehydrogenase [Nocardioides sp. SYSU DS0651]|uniref:PQQ-dependent sugar dehydrogenase n=1 Tax=Nocardioides sp. SYSU DS0651 TaxID=3415955 RepID=UPI003F4B2B98
MRPRVAVLTAVVVLLAALLAIAPPGGTAAAPVAASSAPVTGFRVDVIATGLDHPWEVQQLPSNHLLVTQRNRRELTLIDVRTGSKRNLEFPSSRIWSVGETGLLGLEVDPGFRQNRRIYTCSGWRKADGSSDIRVVAWRIDPGLTRAVLDEVLLAGLPTSSTGRHGGCRLLIAANGSLMIGTGDASAGRKPQSLGSFGGKVLRINRFTGRPASYNRWYDRKGARRYIVTYGHRNIQGLAQRRDGTVWSVEHGSYRDDEINIVVSGRNFGWHPVPGYNESRPMTDHGLPGKQYGARWRSGNPTIAPSGADFVKGTAWGQYRDSLAVAVLKEQRLMFVKLNWDNRLVWTDAPAELRRYGRLRDVTTTAAGSLLVTTDNGGGNDRVLRVRPRS